jgi:hypothetical protein
MKPFRLFTEAECRRLGRCPVCQFHPPTQNHRADCPLQEVKTRR